MRAVGRSRSASVVGWSRAEHAQENRRNLVGRDFRDSGQAGRFRLVAALLAAALIGGLLLASLRMDLIRMRYAMAEAMEQEQTAFAEHRELTVQVQRRRDPARIAARARTMGFVRPERIIDLATSEDARIARSENGVRP